MGPGEPGRGCQEPWSLQGASRGQPSAGPGNCLWEGLGRFTGSFWVCFCGCEKKSRIPGKTDGDKGEGHPCMWVITGGNPQYGCLEFFRPLLG